MTLSSPTNATLGDDTVTTVTITDDDNANKPTVDMKYTTRSVTEHNTTRSITIELDQESGADVTVSYATADGSTNGATAGSDYTAVTAGSATIAAGSTSTTISVPILEDSLYELAETFTVTLSNATNATLGSDTTTTVTINDDDSSQKPTVSMQDATKSVTENATTLSLTLKLNKVSGADVTVDWETANGTATAGTGKDYTAASETATIAEGQTSTTISVTILEDTLYELDETFTVTLSNATNARLGSSKTTTVTINDDDSANKPTVDMQHATRSITEEATTLAVRIRLDKASGIETTVDWVTADGTATAGSGKDYRAASGTATIAEGQTSTTVSVTILEDSLYELAETFTVTLSNATNATLDSTENVTTVTITDDDSTNKPTVSMRATERTVSEGAGTVSIYVGLDQVSGADVTVYYETADSTATSVGSNADYTATSGTLTIAAGRTSATIPVAVIEDSEVEIHETFTVTLSNATNATLGTDLTTTVTITDNENIQLGGGGGGGGAVSASGGDRQIAFTIWLSAVSGRDVTVAYTTVDATAKAQEEYTPVSGRVTIPEGERSATVWVPLLADGLDEAHKTVALVLSDPSDALLADEPSAEGTIRDIDVEPVVSVADVSVSEDAGAASFTVQLDRMSDRDVSVRYATVDRDGAASTADAVTPADDPTVPATGATRREGGDYAPTSGRLTIPAGEVGAEVRVPIVDDALDEFDETFRLVLSDPSFAALSGEGAAAVGVIRDDDDEPVLSVADVSVSEDAGEAVLTVSLDAVSGRDVWVDYATVEGAPAGSADPAPVGSAASAGLDFVAMSGRLRIRAGESGVTLPVPVLDDALDEPAEHFTLLLSGVSAAVPPDLVARVTIGDGDEESVLRIANAVARESAGTLEFTVSLGAPAVEVVSLRYDTVEGTATAGRDYLATAGVLSIPAGASRATVRVHLLDDTVEEPAETLILVLRDPIGATLPDDVQATGLITDDEDLPRLGVTGGTASEGVEESRFTVHLSGPSSRDVSVEYATVDGTASAGVDYTAASGTLTIPAGAIEATITVPVLDDTLDEDSEDFRLFLRYPTGAALPPSGAGGTATIADDDDPPAVRVDGVTGAEGSYEFEFTVRIDRASSRNVSAEFRTVEGSARAGVDYIDVSDVVTIPAGHLSATVPVRILDDALDEWNEDFTLEIDSPTNATLTHADSVATATIDDDDGLPTLIVGDAFAVEGEDLAFDVRLSEVSGRNVSVQYVVVDGTAGVREDYRAALGRLLIPAGRLEGTIIVSLLQDRLDEPFETFQLVLSRPANAITPSRIPIGTIGDDDDPPELGVADVSVDEGASAATFKVRLDRASGRDVSVAYATADATAIAGADYTAVQDILRIPAGEIAATVTVPLLDDAPHEPDETFMLALTQATNAVLARSEATGTIADDDPEPASADSGTPPDDPATPAGSTTAEVGGDSAPAALTVLDATAWEGAGTMSFVVRLDAANRDDAVTVDYETMSGTATAGADYTTTSGTLRFPAGTTTATITVAILSDDLDEADETVTLALTNAVNTTAPSEPATGTIIDDDATPTLTADDATAAENEDVTFTVRLSAPSGLDITVDYATASDSALGGVDYTTTAGTLHIPAGATTATITAPTLEDDIDELDETYVLALADPTNARLYSLRTVGTIIDNDDTPILTTDDATVPEDEDLVLTLTLRNPADSDVTVRYRTTDVTADAGADYVESSGTMIIRAGQTSATLSVPILDDSLDEHDETFTITLWYPTNAVLAQATEAGGGDGDSGPADTTETASITITITIGDDDPLPFVTVRRGTATEPAEGEV